MGLNLDLVHMLGLPKMVECPHCQCMTATDLDDWDVQCGDPNPVPGYWKFNLYCACCEYEWEAHFALIVVGPTKDKHPLVKQVETLGKFLVDLGAKKHEDTGRVVVRDEVGGGIGFVPASRLEDEG